MSPYGGLCFSVISDLGMDSTLGNVEPEKLDFIRPGKPTENARVERFNGSFRRELLDCYVFGSLSEVREKAEEWMIDYNHHRPHESLGDLSPVQFLERHNQKRKLSA